VTKQELIIMEPILHVIAFILIWRINSLKIHVIESIT